MATEILKMTPDEEAISQNLYRLLDKVQQVTVLGLSDILVSRRHVRMPLPVEFVHHFSRKDVPVCDVARAFETRYYLWSYPPANPGPVMHYDKLCKVPGFKGTSAYTEILLAERWCDYGPDGHVEFEMMGWMLVPETECTWPTPKYGAGSGEWPKVEERGKGLA